MNGKCNKIPVLCYGYGRKISACASNGVPCIGLKNPLKSPIIPRCKKITKFIIKVSKIMSTFAKTNF
jgi:hypothetical protein